MPKQTRFVAHREADSVYRWCYVANKNAKAARRSIQFASMVRSGAESDWVNGRKMSQPLVAVAPPKGAAQWQTT